MTEVVSINRDSWGQVTDVTDANSVLSPDERTAFIASCEASGVVAERYCPLRNMTQRFALPVGVWQSTGATLAVQLPTQFHYFD